MNIFSCLTEAHSSHIHIFHFPNENVSWFFFGGEGVECSDGWLCFLSMSYAALESPRYKVNECQCSVIRPNVPPTFRIVTDVNLCLSAVMPQTRSETNSSSTIPHYHDNLPLR